ncbi:Phosphoserine aminotransferase [Candidatus Providencia siddallii]|uniref:Phosphoserine aminotransferase n=1 Tax=Candidatus Providencia siddallii TaxID=1715285 RepID=A0A0M6W784_9GAMM|nr:Phosphoserine aminotransferase [Candidatus Providencia siddallii]
MNKIYNFSAGPAMLPTEVMRDAKLEFCDWNGIGVSILEISHREKYFIEIVKEAEQNLRDLLKVPNNYKILFCHGGARTQFSIIPMNLLGKKTTADYIVSGYWSNFAANEAKKYCKTNIIKILEEKNGKQSLKQMSKWLLNKESAYVHYCPNETISGLAIHEEPIFFKNKTIIADCSSSILSKPIDISLYGVIYASAQKNIGPSGITIVIIREDLLGKASLQTPSVFNYTLLTKHKSMINTPSTFSLYLSGMVLKWLKKQGGLEKIIIKNYKKSQLLYNIIDNCNFYINKIAQKNRSIMNVHFRTQDSKLDKIFIKDAKNKGLFSLKGHKSLGGIRASIYNAMPIDGVTALVDFMIDFKQRYTQ